MLLGELSYELDLVENSLVLMNTEQTSPEDKQLDRSIMMEAWSYTCPQATSQNGWQNVNSPAINICPPDRDWRVQSRRDDKTQCVTPISLLAKHPPGEVEQPGADTSIAEAVYQIQCETDLS